MKLEDVFKAAYYDFQRDFEPETEREKEAFVIGFRYALNSVVSYIIDNGKGGEKS